MRNHSSITQKVPGQNRSTTNRDTKERSVSSNGNNSYNSYRKPGETKINPKESYNGGSTYGEHNRSSVGY